ncbi:hypothetical protein TNIN_20291 [Trichonephila inaurata madagascariensis]|uniref:Uncharacterized protein n=1 Tax=Trichonephila inaurata madagascariensis TaxID=2747483 RepID=A0A8X6JI51_9ARAC|nr:hypothetical protein TNIN_20291 [Trichonephila inaurata madagascariensis]
MQICRVLSISVECMINVDWDDYSNIYSSTISMVLPQTIVFINSKDNKACYIIEVVQRSRRVAWGRISALMSLAKPPNMRKIIRKICQNHTHNTILTSIVANQLSSEYSSIIVTRRLKKLLTVKLQKQRFNRKCFLKYN